ncbi:MAG: hypothetical protein IT245_06695 [Bacteroidia bacterium]|nr:hypothetical protein [Bacteroidia bacterium]
MAVIPQNFEKFSVGRYSTSGKELANKLVDERAFYSIYPHSLPYHELDPAMRKLASANYPTIINGDSLMNIFEQQTKVINVDKDTIRWKLFFDSSDLRASIMGVQESLSGILGLNGASFELDLDSDVYGPNDLIIIEGLTELPLLIKSHPRTHGMKTTYDVVLEDAGDHIQAAWIKTGMQVKAQIGSLRGEGNVTRGNVHWTSGNSFIQFEVPMTSMGWEMKITNKAWLASKHYMIRPNMKEHLAMTGGADVMINEFDAKFKRVTDKQIDLGLAYGRASAKHASPHLDGITGKPMISGPGWYQYLESATHLDFNPYQNIIDFLRTQIPATWNDKVDYADRILDVYTGSGGLTLVQQAGEELDNKGSVIQTAEYNYTSETAFFKGRKAIALGAKQYRAFYIEPFGLVRFHHLPMLDSSTIDTRKFRGLPYQSYEFIVFNDGRGDGREENIYIARSEEESQFLYSTGLWTPTGAAGQNGNAQKYHNGLGDENAYKIIREEKVGMVVKDPTYFTWIRMNMR